AATRAPGAHKLLRTLPMPKKRATERPGRAFAQTGFRYYEDPEPAGRSRLAASERRMRTRSVLRPRAHIGLAARRRSDLRTRKSDRTAAGGHGPGGSHCARSAPARVSHADAE